MAARLNILHYIAYNSDWVFCQSIPVVIIYRLFSFFSMSSSNPLT